jgi:hypothetical protein
MQVHNPERDEMDTWTTTIVDVVKPDASENYFLLVGAEFGPYFGVSAVFRTDLTVDSSKWICEIKPTYATWVGMEANVSGADLLLAGSHDGYDEWKSGALIPKSSPLPGRSQNLWKKDDQTALYAGAVDGIICINSGIPEVDALPIGRVAAVHGYGDGFMIAVGDHGAVFAKRDGRWSRIEDVPTINNFVSVYCESETSIYFTAGYGTALHWDGDSSWTNYDIDDEVFAYNFAQYRGQVYLSSLHCRTYELIGNEAVLVNKSKVANRLRSAGSFLFGLGIAKFEVFDGQYWRTYELDLFKMFPVELEALREKYESI